MHGAVQPGYKALVTAVSVSGLVTLSVVEGAHFSSTRLATPVMLGAWMNATCVPSPESTTDVPIRAPVLYAQYTAGTPDVPHAPAPEYSLL